MRRSIGVQRRLGAAVAVATVALGLAAVAGAASGPSVSFTGTWDCCGAGGAAAQVWILTDRRGHITGKGELPGGEVFARITGTVHDYEVTMVDVYNSFAPGYVARFTGTVSRSDLSATGTWASNRNQSGTWTATLARKKKRKKH